MPLPCTRALIDLPLVGQTQPKAWGFASARHNRLAMLWAASRPRNGPDRRSHRAKLLISRYRCKQMTFFIKQGSCPDTRRTQDQVPRHLCHLGTEFCGQGVSFLTLLKAIETAGGSKVAVVRNEQKFERRLNRLGTCPGDTQMTPDRWALTAPHGDPGEKETRRP